MSDTITPSTPADGGSRTKRFHDALLAGHTGEGWRVVSPATPQQTHAPVPARPDPAALRPGPVVVEDPAALPVPYAEIAKLRSLVAERLAAATAEVPGMSRDDRIQLGQSLVNSVVSVWATDYAAIAGALTQTGEQAVRKAVLQELFQAGRLQPLLDDPDVENILIVGTRVRVDYRDRPSREVGPVAESEEALVALLNQVVRTQGQSERSLTSATPLLNSRLDDGSRLAVTSFVSDRTHAVIRRHRTRSQRLSDLRAWGTLDSTLERFLTSVVKARKNVIIAGSQGAGKTSLMRAMALEIPRTERIGTLEDSFELWLHEDPNAPEVVALEAREGNGERGPDGRPVGEITLTDLFEQSLRMSLRRVLVGEVRGSEALPMLRAFNSGDGGSMATIHAKSAEMVIERLVELVEEAGRTDRSAYRKIALSVDFIVFVRLVDETSVGGSRHRFISQIVEVTGVGERGIPSRQTIFGPRLDASGHREPRAVPHMLPQCIGDLERAGLDRAVLQQSWGAWEQPLRTVTAL
ncbi:Flp pilus assembly CpaF family ATPase [Kitasatospora sp. MAA19]|uniref:CpaF family protein n=1 Tax=Kitasatospora sp. MAA19 TaxID=3035090 RepID=UPI002474FE27|nr:CpaF/VirB11 family protein [Kitasatospora sp. MAA19]MDH6710913.1 Flp pilus assembly CpaF family ATPase [Kitasatospora sp. MAA19]